MTKEELDEKINELKRSHYELISSIEEDIKLEEELWEDTDISDKLDICPKQMRQMRNHYVPLSDMYPDIKIINIPPDNGGQPSKDDFVKKIMLQLYTERMQLKKKIEEGERILKYNNELLKNSDPNGDWD
jgi:hypothetical protein